MEAIGLLEQAIARDPAFLLAYCGLASAQGQLYFLNLDHTPARLGSANAAVQTALRLRPDAGEAHLALAELLYRGYLDYDHARAEIGIAQRTLPNEPLIFELTGYIDRREGHWQESIRNLERAIKLDPRNFFTLQQISLSYSALRRYPETASALDRALEIAPKDAETRVGRATVDLDWRADPRPLHRAIELLRAESPRAVENAADSWFICALAEHDAPAAANALVALGENYFSDDAVRLSRAFGEGLLARMTKDEGKASSAFTAARAQQEKIVQAQPDYGPALCVLGLIDAALGRKEKALREGRHAIELMSVEKDSINGTHMIAYFAIIAAWVGEKDLACEQLTIATRLPGSLSYGQLKLLPYWNPLRGDPCFEKIVASLAPKEAGK